MSLALQGRFLTTGPLGESQTFISLKKKVRVHVHISQFSSVQLLSRVRLCTYNKIKREGGRKGEKKAKVLLKILKYGSVSYSTILCTYFIKTT